MVEEMNELINKFEAETRANDDSFPEFSAGDTINVSVKIKEGNKERVQHFQGVVIQRKNSGSSGETFTVRKISSGIGVHRIFPIQSPNIVAIDVVRRGKVRRARLNYLKGRQGKAARIKEKIQKK